MRIEAAAWNSFAKAADDQGCEHLDELCSARKYTMTGDKRGQKPVVIGGCGNSVLFAVPYESPLANIRDADIKVCAVDDNLPMWPRFGGDRFAGATPDRRDTIAGMDNYDWGDELT